MTSYMQKIEGTPLIADVDTTLTTGDLDYDGTALEVCDKSGNELFDVVVDSRGEKQLWFLPSDRGYRIPLELLERIVETAKQKVKLVDF